MVFSSLIFLYLFLPFCLLGYYLIPHSWRNYWLLSASLIFFAWGGVSFSLVLILSIVLNYLFGLAIQRNMGRPRAKQWLIAGVSSNIIILGIFKYTNFFVSNINELLGCASLPQMPQTHILLPIGISFYTFHSLSYLVDIYSGKTAAQRNIFDLSLYITMFSQLVAGPIIRYSDVWTQLRNREHDAHKFASGVERFTIGLGKKVILANTFAAVADNVFNAEPSSLGTASAWLGMLCYTLQIYCDFAGYSDMAIGIGKMFGFEFMENFNFPYIARTVKDFWRRWHISLSSFFRDYVYIPLGGNRGSVRSTYCNLLAVFFLTGFWHGASWTFILWGLMHGLFMVLERLGLERLLERAWKPLGHLYTLTAVMLAWVLFRAETVSFAAEYWKALFSFSHTDIQNIQFQQLVDRQLILALCIAALGASGAFSYTELRLNSLMNGTGYFAKILSFKYHILSALFYASVIILCTVYLTAGTYNPFIYYRF